MQVGLGQTRHSGTVYQVAPRWWVGNLAHIVWGRERHPGRISLRMEPEWAIDLDKRLVWLVRSWLTPSLGFRLKVAEIHDVYMVVSGESVCEEVHPCRVINDLFE